MTLFQVQGMLAAGEWLPAGEHGITEVRAPYDGTTVARVPAGGGRDVDRAVEAARTTIAAKVDAGKAADLFKSSLQALKSKLN